MHRYKINSLEETEGIIEKQRMIKDVEEIELIQKACSITDECFNYLKSYIKIGLTVDWIFQDKDINYKKQKFLEIHSPNISNEDKAKSYPTNLSKVKKEDFELISEHGKLVTEALAYAYDFNDSNENFH